MSKSDKKKMLERERQRLLRLVADNWDFKKYPNPSSNQIYHTIEILLERKEIEPLFKRPSPRGEDGEEAA